MARSKPKIDNEEGSTLLTQTRRSRGLTLDQVADAVGTGKGNLRRVENGEQVPKRDLARKLYDFYSGAIPLGKIYDARFDCSNP